MSELRVQIESLDQLRIMAQRPVEAFLALGDGSIRSSKCLHYQHSRNGRHWWVFEYITSTERYYTERQFADETNVVAAIGQAALYVEFDGDEMLKRDE